MSGNPLTERIAVPYAEGLLEFAAQKNLMYQITEDLKNLNIFFKESSELTDYLNNPVVSQKAKREILAKTLKSQINTETFNFLMLLVDRDRINILSTVITQYLELMYLSASVRSVKVSTAIEFTASQKETLSSKLKTAINAKEIRLMIDVDPTLIGGFSIQVGSNVLNLTVKNQLQQLAKHLDTVLEI